MADEPIGFDSVGADSICGDELYPELDLFPSEDLYPEGDCAGWGLAGMPQTMGFGSTGEDSSTFGLGTVFRPIDCGGSGPLGWLAFGSEEIGHEGRTLSYLANAAGPANPGGIAGVSPRWDVTLTECCPCPVLLTDDNGTGLTFLRPDGADPEGTGDPAPWYDAAAPESAEFLGVLITDIKGLDSVIARSSVPRGARPGGGFLGVQTQGIREITVQATLVATTCTGLDYGRRWLAHILANDACDDCSTYSLEVRTVCPPGLSPPHSDVGLKTLYGVGLTSGPRRTDDAPGPCDYADVEWTLVAEDPWLYDCPLECLPRTLWGDVGGVDYGSGSGSGDDFVVGWSCTMPASGIIGQLGAVVEIDTGSGLDGRVTISGWDLPDGVSCEEAPTALDPCYRLVLDNLPDGAIVTLDGSRHRLTIRIEDSDFEADATEYVVLEDGEGLDWPDSSGCLPTCLTVVPKFTPSDDAAVTISTRRRYLA